MLLCRYAAPTGTWLSGLWSDSVSSLGGTFAGGGKGWGARAESSVGIVCGPVLIHNVSKLSFQDLPTWQSPVIYRVISLPQRKICSFPRALVTRRMNDRCDILPTEAAVMCGGGDPGRARGELWAQCSTHGGKPGDKPTEVGIRDLSPGNP